MNGLSVDLEDWYSLVARRLHAREIAPSPRVVAATHHLLDLLDETSTKATFFVLGAVAKTFPSLIREVHDRGHEIASHGYGHRRLDAIGPAAFRGDLEMASDAISDACGVRPKGHRAPEFTILSQTSWAFQILAEQDFLYDSSVFPIRHRRYGIASAPRRPYVVNTSAGAIAELPLATLQLFGQRLPTAGGGYLRVLPYRLIEAGVRQANRMHAPAILYVHPYEFDPEPLRMSAPHLNARLFVAGQNAFRGRSGPRLARLLRRYRFGPLIGLIDQ